MFRIAPLGLFAVVIAVLLSLLLGGCAAPQAMPAEFALVAKQIGTSISDQAVYDRTLARIDGQVIDPGLEAYAGMLYIAGAKIRGASGQVKLEGDGAGSGALSPEARAVILRLAEEPGLFEKFLKWASEQAIEKPDEPAPPVDGEEPAVPVE